MKNVWAIYRREMNSYFVSPVAYIVLVVFYLIMGFIFYNITVNDKNASMDAVFGIMAVLLVFTTPLITMRLVAEEKQAGTLELLLTSPITPFQIILGKYLAALSLLLIALGGSLLYVFVLLGYSGSIPLRDLLLPLLLAMVFLIMVAALPFTRFNSPSLRKGLALGSVLAGLWLVVILFARGSMEFGALFSGYLGLIFLCAAYVAIGVLISTLSGSQLVAGVLGIGVSFILMMIDWFVKGKGFMETALRELSPITHYMEFTIGILDIKHVIYFLLWAVLLLSFSTKSLEAKLLQ